MKPLHEEPTTGPPAQVRLPDDPGRGSRLAAALVALGLLLLWARNLPGVLRTVHPPPHTPSSSSPISPRREQLP